MQKDYRNNSYRLRGYDYSQPGFYFLTICTSNRQNLFGEITDNKMNLNNSGLFVEHCWKEISRHFSNIELDEYVIMPNHLHGIIVINPSNKGSVGVQHVEPLRNSCAKQNCVPNQQRDYQKVVPGSLGAVVRGFKSAVTRWFHNYSKVKTVWQRNFYDHIVRDECELARIRLYIRQNPEKWQFDWQNLNSSQIVRDL